MWGAGDGHGLSRPMGLGDEIMVWSLSRPPPLAVTWTPVGKGGCHPVDPVLRPVARPAQRRSSGPIRSLLRVVFLLEWKGSWCGAGAVCTSGAVALIGLRGGSWLDVAGSFRGVVMAVGISRLVCVVRVVAGGGCDVGDTRPVPRLVLL